MVINTINEEMSFCDYYSQWVDVYKEGAIREVTMKKIQAHTGVVEKNLSLISSFPSSIV